MLLSPAKNRALSRVIEILADTHSDTTALRKHVSHAVLELVDADMCASYAWNPQAGCFESGIGINLSDNHTDRYLRYHQYRHSERMSPLWTKPGAVRISDIISVSDLRRTEIYSDLLGPDHHHFGIQLALFNQGKYLSDIRLWRGDGTRDFSDTDKQVLEMLMPALVKAHLRVPTDKSLAASKLRLEALGELSPRETAVAELVALGHSDKEIARKLNVSFATVRTHLGNVFSKLGPRNRTELAALIIELGTREKHTP